MRHRPPDTALDVIGQLVPFMAAARDTPLVTAVPSRSIDALMGTRSPAVLFPSLFCSVGPSMDTERLSTLREMLMFLSAGEALELDMVALMVKDPIDEPL